MTVNREDWIRQRANQIYVSRKERGLRDDPNLHWTMAEEEWENLHQHAVNFSERFANGFKAN